MRIAQIPPLAWAGAMMVLIAVLAIAATTIEAVKRLDAEVVAELQGEVAVTQRGPSRRRGCAAGGPSLRRTRRIGDAPAPKH